jgi:hypothetical protein
MNINYNSQMKIINKIFVESPDKANEFYKKLKFNFDDKTNFTDSEEQIDCTYFSKDEEYKITKFILSNKNYGNLANNSEFYLYLFNNDDIVAQIGFTKDIHITGRYIFFIRDYKYNNLSDFSYLLEYLEYIAIINNYSFIHFELSIQEEKELFDHLISLNFKEVFNNSGIIRKFIPSNNKIQLK